jgi:large subunit ribosomal protein L18
MAKHTAHLQRLRRHRRVRRKVAGTPERPRLAVFRSNQHIYAQLIDDAAGHTIAAASDAETDVRDGGGTKVQRAQAVGKRLAERSKQAGIEAAVFDRGGFRYAGRVRALAEAAREEGLVF